MATYGDSAANRYAARVDAVLAQRTRLRGPQPPGDKRAACPADHPLMKADPLRPLGPNLAVIASYIEADDVVIDVGGGAGRMSLPLALRCREVINVEPSPTMAAGFRTNAAGAGITNTRIIEGEWPTVDAPAGSIALVNHVTYLTREILPFIKKLEQAGRRRVLITVNSEAGTINSTRPLPIGARGSRRSRSRPCRINKRDLGTGHPARHPGSASADCAVHAGP